MSLDDLEKRVKKLEKEMRKTEKDIDQNHKKMRRRFKKLRERDPYEIPDEDTGEIRLFMPSVSIGKIKWKTPPEEGGKTFYALILEEVEE